MEVEAKFLVQDDDQFEGVLRTLRNLGYTVTRQRTENLVDRYFDTRDWSILRAGWSYRCRAHDGHEKITLKSLGSRSGPVFARDAIEQAIPDASTARPDELPSGRVQQKLINIVDGERCRELFKVRNRRSVYSVAAPGGDPTRVELGLDRARISAKKKRKPAPGNLDLTELELELDQGRPETMEQLAEVLRKNVGLVPAQLSKFERGMQAAGLPRPGKRRAKHKRSLGPKGSILTLAYDHVERQLEALQMQQPLAWEGLDPAGVHKMRVAIRRIRSVFAAFSEMFSDDASVELEGELHWLMDMLGAVRDADVYGESFQRYLEAQSADNAGDLDRHEQHRKAAAEHARSALLDALSSARYAKLLASLERFVRAGPAADVRKKFARVRIAHAEKTTLRPAIKRMKKRGRRIRPDSPDKKLHRLRIEGKRVRYLLEFFSAVRPKRLKPALKAARRFQDDLGEHQDATTACARIENYAGALPLTDAARAELLALGGLRHYQQSRLTRSRRRFPKIWKRFTRGISIL